MHVHLRIRRWVTWWFYVGLIFGAIALANVLFRDLTRAQEREIFFSGVMFWTLGGLICYAFDGIRVMPRMQKQGVKMEVHSDETEWHPASDFLLPGNHH